MALIDARKNSLQQTTFMRFLAAAHCLLAEEKGLSGDEAIEFCGSMAVEDLSRRRMSIARVRKSIRSI